MPKLILFLKAATFSPGALPTPIPKEVVIWKVRTRHTICAQEHHLVSGSLAATISTWHGQIRIINL